MINNWFFLSILLALCVLILYLCIKKADLTYKQQPEEQNPYEGKKVIFVEIMDEKKNADGICGHLEVIGISKYQMGFYEKYIKRMLDIIFSFLGIVLLSPVFLAIVIAIFIDDPGPIFFVQKRVGKNKQFFKLHKFRSMKMSTPRNMPTHRLENMENYLTKTGKFLRYHSLDELPQLLDIIIGNMSLIGPRPALWNQDYLISERDKHGANDVKPGLSGYAQINGRDELNIIDKARLDGVYVKKIGFCIDIKILFHSIGVFKGDINSIVSEEKKENNEEN